MWWNTWIRTHMLFLKVIIEKCYLFFLHAYKLRPLLFQPELILLSCLKQCHMKHFICFMIFLPWFNILKVFNFFFKIFKICFKWSLSFSITILNHILAYAILVECQIFYVSSFTTIISISIKSAFILWKRPLAVGK